ncbi:mechanosensitive ion channel family protein [Photobacterium sanguinicancri]|uniref:mechanosensitive ion channel family protein n=1 Tax=Photobacterium sanguinicancri TaxID=875932 RepID=UPI0026E42DAD|nr:mechanosensitive ion channel family protein [Photobacterium sanguinicancri]MDO6499480.1 mechanosensitive ion channel family protein [Photobacterium sanguinicancri]
MEKMTTWWVSLEQGSSPDWLFNVGLLLTLSAVLWGAWWLISRRLAHIAETTKIIWDDALVHAVRRPVSWLIWLWPALISVGVAVENTSHYSTAFLVVVRHLLLVWTLTWVLLRLISNVEVALADKAKDLTTLNAVSKVLRLIVMVIGGLVMMQNLGLSLSGILTFGGVGGLVVGMAAKDLLANFFGGMMIYFDRPFKVGDWIRSPDRLIEGTVERIGFRMTVIRTFDKRPLYVPNSVFSSIVVENPSRMSNRRIKQKVGLRYQDAAVVGDVVEGVKQMLRQHPEIDSQQTLIVSFDNYGPSSLDILVYTFTKTVNWIEYKDVQQDVMLKIVEIVHQHGADFAFPTSTVQLGDNALMALQSSSSKVQFESPEC